MEVAPVSSNTESAIISFLELNHYGPLKNEEKLREELDTRDMTFDQALSLRRHLLRNKAMKRSGKLKHLSPIQEMYSTSKSVLAVAKHFEQPPMSILRVLFKKKYGLSITKIFNNPDVLDAQDYDEFKTAQEHDFIEGIDPNIILKQSLEYENVVESWLRAQNVSYKTQDDILRESHLEKGKEIGKGKEKGHLHLPLLTPDFLIESKCSIGGKPINWIDAKNFYGTKKSFLYSKLVKQAKKYVNAFGPGAMVFSLGCSDEVSVKRVIMCQLNSKIISTHQ